MSLLSPYSLMAACIILTLAILMIHMIAYFVMKEMNSTDISYQVQTKVHIYP